jgi:hypothetical protein
MPVILATWEVEIRRTAIQGQPKKVVQETPSQPIKNWEWWCVPVIPAKMEAQIGGSQSRLTWA